MKLDANQFEVRLAQSDDDVRAAQNLRYRVFVHEMGAHVSREEHVLRLERDDYDPYFDHLLLIDRNLASDNNVVGVYRLMRGRAAQSGIGFYGAQEYDLSKLLATPRKTVELGRSCVAKEYRGGVGMHLLWDGLGEYVTSRGIEIMFGVASFHGTDVEALADALSFLHHKHLAPEDLRVRVIDTQYVSMNRKPLEEINNKAALRAIPSLIKAYLRLGGFVGDGAFIDREFNTVDVCLLMDTKRMAARYRDFYARKRKAIR